MVLREPKCYTRKCRHFGGVKIIDGNPVNWCAAFLGGIPDEIAYGDNPHTEPFPNDGGIRYKKRRD
jgi:hypothetical protein